MLFEGIRVVELGVWVAGPAVGGLMADWHADVVKIEPPTGDPMRFVGPVVAGLDLPSSPPFTLDDRGKRSVVLDLRKEEGLEIARRLILKADVFLTNYRARALERLGLDYTSLSSENPRLIYAHVTGHGREGPDRDRAAYDIGVFWARTGIAHLLSTAGFDEPIPSRFGFGDHIAATHALAGIGAALFHRSKTGEGQLVDTCLLRSGMYTVGSDICCQLELGLTPSQGPRAESSAPTVTHYRAGDGRWFWLLGLEAQRHWPLLLEALDRTDLQDDPRFASAAGRRENARSLITILDEEFAKRPLTEWIERFDKADVWWSPVQTPAEAIQDPQAIACGAFVDVPAPGGKETVRSVGSPVRFGRVDTTPRAGIPALGEHTEEVLSEAGLSADEIQGLRARAVLG
jgi:crotonobetainyl-CoA:carnitine CoA-transferase CaiB-like acyl-CoA transferase